MFNIYLGDQAKLSKIDICFDCRSGVGYVLFAGVSQATDNWRFVMQPIHYTYIYTLIIILYHHVML